jgi:hypothetical protein
MTDPAPEERRMLDYLRTRAAALTPPELRARVRAAAGELDQALAGVAETDVRRQPLPGEWSLAQVVDHVAQTTARCAEELRHLLAGRRPPAPPVYEALTSGAALWAPWVELVDGLRASNAEYDAVLAIAATAAAPAGVTARAILVVNREVPDGRTEPLSFSAELGWKEYALVQRLHLLDHRNQARKVRAALATGAVRA